MKQLFVAAAILAVCQSVGGQNWKEFKQLYNKIYISPEEDALRKSVYLKNVAMIEAHNIRFKQGAATYETKVNKYADLESKEFGKMLNGYVVTPEQNELICQGEFYVRPQSTLPKFVDWRATGAVSAVPDQRKCGSCWSFSATGALEGQNYLKRGKRVSLSQQNLMDCTQSYGNDGCNGGMMSTAFQYVQENPGINPSAVYPYEAKESDCRFKPDYIATTNSGYRSIKSGSEIDLQAAVAWVGPISVAMDASASGFQFYRRGIYFNRACKPQNINHGVLAIGYGSQDGQDYWIIRNSWGTGWGEKGYFKIARNKNNHCGIATQASYPLLDM